MRLYFWLGGAVGVLALIIAAFFYGVGVGKDREAATLQKKIDRMAEAAKKLGDAAQAADERAAGQDVARQTLVREIVREVPKIIDRPVYRNVCIDADGVDLLRRSVAAANGELEPPAGRSDGAAGGVR